MNCVITTDAYKAEFKFGGITHATTLKQISLVGVGIRNDDVVVMYSGKEDGNLEITNVSASTITYNGVPVASAYALYVLLLLWITQSPSALETFIAAPAQAVFTMTNATLKTYVMAIINGVYQSWGYTWVVGAYDVTFAAPFVGGEEVTLVTFG